MTNIFGANQVYNETFEDNDDIPNQEKRFQVAVSAAFPGNQFARDGITHIDLTAVRPPTLDDVVFAELGAAKNWTDPTAWKFDPPRIPEAGEDIVIDMEMNILYDVALADSVVLRSLEING